MRILDMSAGKRMVWFEKAAPEAVFVDLRESVQPSVVADTRGLPFKDSVFSLVVFDPPHVNVGANSNMAKDFGHHTTAEIRSIVAGSAKEAHRVSTLDALMAFKWNDHDQSFANILALMRQWWRPLFGAQTAVRTKHSCTTAWVMLHRVS